MQDEADEGKERRWNRHAAKEDSKRAAPVDIGRGAKNRDASPPLRESAQEIPENRPPLHPDPSHQVEVLG